MCKRVSILSLILLFISLLTHSTHAASTDILITAFEPFGGASGNRSQDTAQAIKADLEAKGYKVTICVLPVAYDRATVEAKKCFDKMPTKPGLAFSLGEGSCDIRLETAAYNLDNTFGYPDNDGEIREMKKIIPDGPNEVAFPAFVARMYCSLSPLDRQKVRVSESPGNFVCNNTAYRLGLFFSEKETPYSFIHVPALRCQGQSSSGSPLTSLDLAKQAGHTIAGMIDSLRPETLQNPSPDFQLSSVCTLLPTSSEKIATLLGQMKQILYKTESLTCNEDFLNRLNERIHAWGDHSGKTY